ncbi:unnamed protein product, partial [Rotaria magnacalcarata]
MQLSQKCNVGDFLGLQIHKIDRTNTDPKLLPSIIIEKEDEQTVNVLLGLFAVSHELVHLKVDDLQKILMITASKLYVRGAVNGVCCLSKPG